MPHASDAVQLARDLVEIDSAGDHRNVAIAEFLAPTRADCGFDVERTECRDDRGQCKVNLVAVKGRGPGGRAFFAHCNTVPGTGWGRDPWRPVVEDGRLLGLGSCDTKGPLAATIAACAAIEASRLRRRLSVVITADEEARSVGARHVAEDSARRRAGWPSHGVLAEPTRLIPVHAHKGSALVTIRPGPHRRRVDRRRRAAESGRGRSANDRSALHGTG